MQEKKVLTQGEVLANELIAISSDVTRADRTAFLEKHPYSKTTLSNYMNGTVSDNDTALLILKFMRQRIADRYAEISK